MKMLAIEQGVQHQLTCLLTEFALAPASLPQFTCSSLLLLTALFPGVLSSSQAYTLTLEYIPAPP